MARVPRWNSGSRYLCPLDQLRRRHSPCFNPESALDRQRLIATTRVVPIPYDIETGKAFSLAGLPGDNADFFDGARGTDNSEASMRSVAKRLRLQTWGLYDAGNRRFVVPMTYTQPDSTPTERWLIYKYDMTNALHVKLEFDSECEYGLVKFVSYSLRNDRILALVLSKTDGWSLLSLTWAWSHAE